jgi:hypothetical protein
VDYSPSESTSLDAVTQKAGHPVFFAGASFEGRGLTSSCLSGTGVVNLKYGQMTSADLSLASPQISVYEFVPDKLDPEILQA